MSIYEGQDYQAISPFPTVFSTHLENFQAFSSNLRLLSANSFSLEKSKTLSFGKGLKLRNSTRYVKHI